LPAVWLKAVDAMMNDSPRVAQLAVTSFIALDLLRPERHPAPSRDERENP
jgi:hypothetical protein